MTTLILSLAIVQTKTVTFTHPCAHSSVVLEALGKELGVPMKPTGSVLQDYILVRFNDVPVDQALDKIAKTLNASWRESNGVRYLERTPAQEQQDFEGEYEAKARAIRDVIDARGKVPLTQDAALALAVKVRDFGAHRNNDDWERFQPIARQLPGHRAMLDLMALLDIGSIVRSTQSPLNYSQRKGAIPLPSGARKVIDGLAKEWQTYAEALAKSGLASDDVYQKFSGSSTELMESMQLSAHVSEDGVLFMLSFLVRGEWQNLGYHKIETTGARAVPEWVSKLEGASGLSTVAKESIQPTQLREVREGLRAAVLAGGEPDLLLCAPSELIARAAGKRTVVAYVPDSAYVALAEGELPADATLSLALGKLFTARSIVAQMDDQWLTVRPAKPYTDRFQRMDRSAFLKMARSADELKSLPLDQFADFVATTVDDATVKTANHLFGRSFRMSVPLPMVGLDVIRLYGLLPRAERAQAMSGGIMLSGRTDFHRYAIPIAQMSQVLNDFDDGGARAAKRPLRERQDALDSLPKETEFSLKVTDTAFVQPRSSDQKVGAWAFVFDVDSFALNAWMAERRPESASSIDYSSVAPITGSTLYFEHRRLNGNGSGMHFGRYADPLTELKFGSLNDLPEKLRKDIEQGLANVRKRNGGG